MLDKLAGDLLREGIHSHSEIRQGVVAEMLVDVARQYEAGLIVIGTKGMEGAGPVVVGAIAEQLVRLAPCPVLAVAADWNAGPYRPTPGGPVLMAMERNDAAAAAAATAYSLAETFERPLLVLHVRTAAEQAAGMNPCATMEDFGIEAGGKAQVRCLVKDGNPADAVAEAIAEYHPCILVAGVKRASGDAGSAWDGFCFAVCLARAGSLRSSRRGARRGGAGSCASRGNPVTGADRFRAETEFHSRNGTEEWAGERRNRTMLSDRKKFANSAGLELTR